MINMLIEENFVTLKTSNENINNYIPGQLYNEF